MSGSPPKANNTSLHIAVDMDDVIVDFVGGLLEAIKTEYNIEIDPESITQWDLHPLLDPIIGYSWWRWLRDREWLWANFPAMPGAIGNIEKLRREGHYIEIITSKPEWAEHNVWKWLGKWRPAVNRVTIVKVDQPKHAFTNAVVLIDDKLENCQGFTETGRYGILFRSYQNRDIYGTTNRALHAESWNDIPDIIERIQEEKSWPVIHAISPS